MTPAEALAAALQEQFYIDVRPGNLDHWRWLSEETADHLAEAGWTLVETGHLARLEALADVVADRMGGLPDHPWIPGGQAWPVLVALQRAKGWAESTIPEWAQP